MKVFFLIAGIFLISCATTRPCSSGGDTSWVTPLKGDSFCRQKPDAQGNIINHGEYYKKNKDGVVILKGLFKEGKKHGIWIQYDEKGEKKVVKNYVSGVEMNAASKSESEQRSRK